MLTELLRPSNFMIAIRFENMLTIVTYECRDASLLHLQMSSLMTDSYNQSW